MIPSVEHVMKKRHHNRRRLRFMALALVVVGMIFAGCGVFVEGMVEHEWPTLSAWTAIGAAFVLPAIPLWLLNDWIGRALVPMPKNQCPQCRYDLTGLVRAVCPECGLGLPAGLVVGDRAGGSCAVPAAVKVPLGAAGACA